ncbi:MAG: gliding motility-associated C-terminal domain-containing protein, partial [Flavobacteriales bacterium]
TDVQIDEAAFANASTPTAVILCPEIENVMTISSNTDFFTWFIECPGADDPIIPLSEITNSVTITSSMIPQDCWGGATVVGTAQSNCGNSQVSFNVAVDACEIIIPNIFTPHNQDNLNDAFVVDGLDVYNNVILKVFNRWGNLIYESEDYKNGEWSAKEESEGTYFYVLILENGIEHTGTVLVKH